MNQSSCVFSFLRFLFRSGNGDTPLKKESRNRYRKSIISAFLFAYAMMFFGIQDVESTSPSAAVIPGRGCDLFTESFAKDTRFAIIDWAGRSQGLALLEPGLAPYEIIDQQISLETGEQEDSESVKFNGEALNRETTDVEDAAKIQKKIIFKTSAMGKTQLDALFSQFKGHGSHAGWLVLRDLEKKNLYRLDLSADETRLRSLFDAGFVEVKYHKGAIVKYKALNKENRTATIFPDTSGDISFLRFRNFLNLKYSLPYNMTLTQVPKNLSQGSLRVVDSVRAVERTSLRVNLKHSNKPFESMVFRGCIGPQNSIDGSFTWTEIPNFTTLSVNAGSAQLAFDIPTLNSDVSPGFFGALSNIFFGGKGNNCILIMAATDAGIQYTGKTDHFIDDRWTASWMGLIALAFAYGLPFAFLWRKDSDTTIHPLGANRWYSLLKLIRGRNGTASLSNLQIWWWTLAVFSLLFYVWAGTGTLASLNSTIMWLLGVTSGGSISAKLLASRRDAAEHGIVATLTGRTVTKTTALDLIKVGHQVSLTKLQMLLFTIITGVYVVATVWTQLEFPVISTEMLTLMGISNGVYVLGKINNSNPHVELATLMVQKETLTEQRMAMEARKDELDQEIDAVTNNKEESELTDDQKKQLESIRLEQSRIVDTIKKMTAQNNEIDARIEKTKAKIEAAKQ